MEKILKEEEKIKELVDGGYHAALQKVVFSSQSAYDFLSFRRSIIRIFRALAVGLLLSFILSVSGEAVKLFHSTSNGLIFYLLLVIHVALFAFIRYRMIKLQVGYYKAITNFYLSSEEKKSREND